MRVLGVDPGSAVTGFGIVEGAPGNFHYVAAGTIRSRAGEPMTQRLRNIHARLLAIVDEFAPGALSLERNFVARNVQSAFRIGEARAIVMLAAAERELPLYEYPPNTVKLAVAAFGHADKQQIAYMVRRTLGLGSATELTSDATDALALAVCHLSRAGLARLRDKEVRPRAARQQQ